MTITSRPTTGSTSRYHWVPAAAGWTIGIIATLSLIASVSPGVRWLIGIPREFVNNYIFNFPDTSFAWASRRPPDRRGRYTARAWRPNTAHP